MDSLVIANIERNELKTKTRDLEEELAAKKAALKQVSRENAELKSRVELLLTDQSGATVIRELSDRIEEMKENLQSRQTILQEINKENQELKQKMAASANTSDLLSQIEEFKRNIKKAESQNEQLDAENTGLKQQLSRFQGHDIFPIDPAEHENLKQNLEQVYTENEQLKSKVYMLESDVQMRESLEQADKLSSLLAEKEDEIGRLHHAHSKLLMRLETLDKGETLPDESNGGSAELEIEVQKLKLQIDKLQDSSISESSQLGNLRQNLELKEDALKQVSKENEELRARLAIVDSSDLKSLLEESHRKLQEMSVEAAAKEEQLQKFRDIQNELRKTKARSISQDEEIVSLKTQLAVLEDNSLSETSQMENLRQNLKLKQETVNRLNCDNEDLRSKVEQLEAGAEENKKRFEELTRTLALKEEEVEKLQDVSSELEESQKVSHAMEGEIATLQKQIEAMEDKVKQQTLQQLMEENDQVKMELKEKNQQLLEVNERLSIKEDELETIVRERDQKFIDVMDQVAEKEMNSEDLKKNIDQLNTERQQLAKEVCISRWVG